nr:hypothetical protein [Tanacetum cinerariifolium]
MPHKINEEELVKKLMFVAKGEPKGKPTFGMPIPEAMMNREIKESDVYLNYLAKTKARHATLVLEKEVNKEVDEAYNAQLKESTVDGKTKSDKDSYHGDKSDNSDQGDDNDDFDKEYDFNEPREVEMIKLLNEPMYTKTTTLTVVPLLDTIHETQEDDLADQVMESLQAVAATITSPIVKKEASKETSEKGNIEEE